MRSAWFLPEFVDFGPKAGMTSWQPGESRESGRRGWDVLSYGRIERGLEGMDGWELRIKPSG